MSQPEIILRLNAMGDILLLVPVLREFARLETQIHLVINRRWAELAEFLPAQVHFFNGPASMLKLIADLQKLEPEAIHDLQGKLSTIAMRLLIKAPRATDYRKRSLTEQLQSITGRFPLRFTDQRPVWQKYADTCGVSITEPNPLLNLPDDYLTECSSLLSQFGLQKKRFFFIHADAAKAGKALPAPLLPSIATALGQTAVLTGTGSEPVILPDNAIDLRNKISLRQLPGFFHLSSGVVSSDSGPMHLARAVDVPVVGIFIQTAPSLGFSPVPGKQVLIISRELECKPCSLHGHRSVCPLGHFACRNLDHAEVTKKIRNFFGALA